MKILKLATAFNLVALMGISSLSAAVPFQFGLHFKPGFPRDDFKENIDRTAWGGSMYFAYRLPRSPISVGTSLSFHIYGRKTRWEPLSPSIPEMTVKIATTNSILLWHLFLRLQPQDGIVRPYLDVLAGLIYLTTDTSIDNNDNYSGSLSSNNYNDAAFNYGAGGGIMVPLLRVVTKMRRAIKFSMDLDIGAQYLKGGEAEYLKKGSIIRDRDEVSYLVYRSHTDLVTAYVGLSFSF